MSSRVSKPDPVHNGQLDLGDAHEPEGVRDASFDPAEFEQAAQAADPDPFDPASLRLTQDFHAAVGVKKAILSIPHRKPDKSWWVRVHPSEDYRLQTAVIELKDDREIYLVAPNLWPELATETTFKPKLLVTAVNRQGVLFLWECNLPRADGRADEWSRTALEAVNMATKQWVRVQANMNLGAYDVAYTDKIADPEWPELSLAVILKISFKDHFISSPDHPVLRKLRGEL